MNNAEINPYVKLGDRIMIVEITGLARKHKVVERYKEYNVLCTIDNSPVVYEEDVRQTTYLDINLYGWLKT
jgi:hypothetical protein